MAMNAKHIDYAISSKRSIIIELRFGGRYRVACVGEYREVVMIVVYTYCKVGCVAALVRATSDASVLA